MSVEILIIDDNSDIRLILDELIKPYFTTKDKGTGLGLSIVDKIISDHNGSIQFLNHKNGAKVQIILPNK